MLYRVQSPSVPPTHSMPASRHAPVTSLVRERSQERPEAMALLAPGREPLRYAALSAQAAHLRAALRAAGVARGSRVALALPNGPEMAAALVAVIGVAACVPVNPAAPAAEVARLLARARAGFVLVVRDGNASLREAAREAGALVVEAAADPRAPAGTLRIGPPVDPAAQASPADEPAGTDVALVLQTSGTSGEPKLVALTHAQLSAATAAVVHGLALTAADRCLNVRPLFHVNGIVTNVLATLCSGGSLICTPAFDEARFFDWIAAFEPTWFSGVPTMHQWIVANGHEYRAKAPHHRFRFVRSGAAPLAPATLRELEALLDAPVVEAYGMTERSPIAMNPLPPGLRKPGSVGLPAGVEIALLDADGRVLPRDGDVEGEIAIRGDGVIGAYESGAQDAFVDGWLRTGDLGRLDADGYLCVTGRLKDIVNRGGQKVSPREIEDALLAHPAVARAAAFGVPHPSLGEEPACAVVLRDGAWADAKALRAHVAGRLASYKVPSTVLVVPVMPLGPTGKVLVDALRRAALDASGGPHGARPVGEREQAVADAFGQLLDGATFARDDSFFARGGDSLGAARVAARLSARTGVELDATTVFRHPTPAALAQWIDDRAASHDDVAHAIAAEIAGLSDEDVARLLSEAEAEARAGTVARPPAS